MQLFDRQLTGFGLAETRHGETIQQFTARELGDADLWRLVVAINDLLPPFITDDAAQVRPGVVLSGSMLKVPSPATDLRVGVPEVSLGRDVDLRHGKLDVDAGGDLLTVVERLNLHQALKHRLVTDFREIIFHPVYGSEIRSLIGTVTGETANLLAAQFARVTVEADPRIHAVLLSEARTEGDVIHVFVKAETIAQSVVEVEAVV